MVDLRPRAHGLRVAALAARRAAIRNNDNDGMNNTPPNDEAPPPQRDMEEMPPPPQPGRVRGGRGRGRGGRAGRMGDQGGRNIASPIGAETHGYKGRGLPPPYQPPPPPDAFHRMLRRMGFSNEAIVALGNLGIIHIESLCDVTEKDIPSMIKEVWRGNIFVRQISQNVMRE